MMRKVNSFCAALLMGMLAGGNTALAVATEGGMDAGAQMERARRDMEREQVMEQIAEDEAARQSKVEQGEKASAEEAGTETSFELKQVNCGSSEILSQEEIAAVTSAYIGRQVTVKDLQEMAGKITDLYREKGYMTCGAVLPPQRIHEGVVEIRLIEGKTGEVTVTGNRHTKESYITGRLGLKPGEIANVDKLNRDLRWFHGTNDMQLRVVMKPGEEEGTTDCQVMAFEPPNHSVTLYTDNDGYKTSGRWRGGVFYTMRSLTGHRDSLRANFIGSQGTAAWSLGYSVPISKKGMRLELNYSGNRTKVRKGELKPLGVEGRSSSYSLTWRAPFYVTEHSRHEAGLQYVYQTSKTQLGHGTSLVVPWVEDRIQRLIPYAAFTHYWDSSVLYHKHSFVAARRRDIDGVKDTGKLYRLNAFWQQRFQSGQFLQARLDGQWSNSKFLASSDRFFIGGVSSVRGYEEGFIGAEKGLALGIEYHVPVDKARGISLFPFFDWGKVSGDTAPAHRTLMSAGAGVEVSYKNRLRSALTVGFPFKRTFYEKRLSAARVDFNLSVTF